MLFKTTVLFFAATALVAVSAAPAPAFDSFPNYSSPNVAKVQEQLIQLFKQQSAAANPVTPKPNTPPKPSTLSKGKRDDSAIETNIEKYALYARAAYQINSKEWNCPRCTTDQRMTGSVVEYHFDEKSGPSFGYVAHNVANKEIIVAFRGTTTLADMVTDLKLSLTDWQGAGSGAKVHLGFKKAVLSVARPIEGLILTLLTQHTDHSIVFVGHSLGGAQASLAAAKFVAGNNAHKNKVSLYTYGQPRTGNSAFATWMNAQAFPKYRVTYGNDLITHLPFGGDYTHHTREIYYNHDDEIKLCSTSNGEDPDCINSVAGTSFKDHSEYPGLEIVQHV